MLSVQPVKFSPAFKQAQPGTIPYDDPSQYSAKEEWEGYKDQFESLEQDSNLPKPVRNFAKFMKVVSGAVVTGLGVVWASKKAGNLSKEALNSKVVTDFKEEAGKVYKKAKGPVKKLIDRAKVFYNEKMANSAFMKKLSSGLEKFKETKFGKFCLKLKDAVIKMYNTAKNGVKASTEEITFDKVNNTTANVLGTGSGIATAYEIARSDGKEEE